MKSITRSAVLFVLIAFGMQATAIARVGPTGVTARAAIDEAPIRAEANPTSAIIATLREGDPVDIVDSRDGWYRVVLPGSQGKPRVGFILMRLVEIVDADATSPERPIDSPQAPTADRPANPTVQGFAIPPVPMPVQRPPNKAAQREQKLKARDEQVKAKAEAEQAQREQKLKARDEQVKAKAEAEQAQREQKLKARDEQVKAKAEAEQAQREQKLKAREQKLKAKVDALQAELDALTSGATNSRR